VTLVVFVKRGQIVRSFDHPRRDGDFSGIRPGSGWPRTRRDSSCCVRARDAGDEARPAAARPAGPAGPGTRARAAGGHAAGAGHTAGAGTRYGAGDRTGVRAGRRLKRFGAGRGRVRPARGAPASAARQASANSRSRTASRSWARA
jgi:hypothetical protein